jgi:hypothetical protein
MLITLDSHMRPAAHECAKGHQRLQQHRDRVRFGLRPDRLGNVADQPMVGSLVEWFRPALFAHACIGLSMLESVRCRVVTLAAASTVARAFVPTARLPRAVHKFAQVRPVTIRT